MYDAFSFESLKHSFREIKYQFWRGRVEGQENSEDTFLLKEERKILLPNRLKK